MVLSATGGLAWFGGPFFVWWLSTQYAEKTRALEDVSHLKAEVDLIKNDIEYLKSANGISYANMVRIEDKVDIILLNIDRLDRKLGKTSK